MVVTLAHVPVACNSVQDGIEWWACQACTGPHHTPMAHLSADISMPWARRCATAALELRCLRWPLIAGEKFSRDDAVVQAGDSLGGR